MILGFLLPVSFYPYESPFAGAAPLPYDDRFEDASRIFAWEAIELDASGKRLGFLAE